MDEAVGIVLEGSRVKGGSEMHETGETDMSLGPSVSLFWALECARVICAWSRFRRFALASVCVFSTRMLVLSRVFGMRGSNGSRGW